MMKIAFFQYPVVFGDRAANFEQISEGLAHCDFDLLLLPELCTTGYSYGSRENLARYAESARDGETVQFLLALSAMKRATLVAGIVESDGDQIYNSAVVVSHGRWLGRQRKCHLSRIEKPLFDAGTMFDCFDDEQCRFGVLTCFDLWMPEAARLLMRQGVQLLCCPANYGGPHTSMLARARAIENACFLICCNRSGEETHTTSPFYFRGDSQIIGRMGEVLSNATTQTFFGASDIDPQLSLIKANPICDDLMQEAARYTLADLRY